MEGEYVIQLEGGSTTLCPFHTKKVAIPLRNAVKEELTRMESLGVISKVTEPTDWCAGMVIVPKKNNKARICVDLTKLNQSVKRERHQLPSVDQTLASMIGAKIFTKLDANSDPSCSTISTSHNLHNTIWTVPF